MSNSNRISGTAPLTKQRENSDGGYQGPTGDDADGINQASNVSVLIEQPSGQNKPVESQQQAQGQEENPYIARDIIAQETMADAAIWMAIAAFITALITSVGTLFIWRQVSLTRKAVKDTGEATKAMLRQNEIAERANRPWLAVDLQFDFTSQNSSLFFCEVTIKNIGSSPAYDVIVQGIEFNEFSSDPTHNLEGASDNLIVETKELYSAIILPGAETVMQINPTVTYETVQAGTSARPKILVVANYTLCTGRRVQTSVLFRLGYKTTNTPIPHGATLNRENVKTELLRYVKAT